MQKLIKRSSYAQKYAARKLNKQKALDDRMHQVKDRLEREQVTKANLAAHKQYKQERWESIYRGQLAPRYDIGGQAERYGTVSPGRSKNARIAESRRVKCPFVLDDRVVLVGAKYRDRGRIGKIIDIDDETQSLKIEGVELAYFYQEPYMRSLTQLKTPSAISSLPIPFADVRLVFPLVHPETGVLRDVIINEIELRNPSWQEKRAGIEKPIRSIAGVVPEVELPYPEERDLGHKDTASDTLRIEVEERTWVPTLGVPPMPPSIIDELRHKYSIFRTRYDDEFIAKKEAAAQRIIDKKKALKLAARTPYDEINLAKRIEQRQKNVEAAKDGAWTPLSPEVIQRMATLALESEKRTGRKLPMQAKEQFELIIANEFQDDPEPEMALAEVVEDFDQDEFDQEEDEFTDEHEQDPRSAEAENDVEKQPKDKTRL